MSCVFHALSSWYRELFEPHVYPELSIDYIFDAVKSQEKDLRAYYDSVDDPEVLFRIFYIRVLVFGWTREEALKSTPKTKTVEVYGRVYELKEFYECSKSPAVTYSAFYNRVVVRNWCPVKAIKTPNLP